MPEPVSIAVIDIDGVVADVRHRLHHLRRQPPRWDRFFRAADQDPVLEVGADLVRSLAEQHTVVWLSGRPESLRRVTVDWLARHDLPGGRMELREPGDYRPARIMKLARVRALAHEGTIAAVVDDDPDVVDTLAAAGFPTALADWVPHQKTLHRAQERQGRT